MKRVVVILSGIILSSTLNAQNIIIFDYDTLKFLNIIDSDTLYQVERIHYKPRMYRERQRLQYLNADLIDSSGISFRHYPKLKGNLLYSSGYDRQTQKTTVYEIDLKKQRLNRLLESNVFLPREGIWSDKSDGKVNGVVLKYVPEENEIVEFNDLINFFSDNEFSGLGDEIYWIVEISELKVLVETCIFDGGAYDFKYYSVTSEEVKPVSFSSLQVDVQTRTGEEEELFRVNFYFSHYDYDFLMAAVDYGDLPKHTDLIFSKDLQDTTHVIKKHQDWEIIGENIQQGKNQFFYLRSKLDDGEKVIVSYKVNKIFEEVSYQVFKGQLVNKSQIKTFNKEQLGILKNMVFAKHNYAFSSDFYQAYFNLFAFYDDEKKRVSRTKAMNGLLTETDAKNLEVIKKTLEKYD